MKVLHVKSDETPRTADNLRKMHDAHVTIVDGVIVKNRNGKTGGNIRGAVYIWDERPVGEKR